MTPPKPDGGARHTATQWRLAEMNCGDGRNISAQVPNGDHPGRHLWVGVAHTSAVRFGGEDAVSPAEAKANADLIVRAVNCHEEMVAACEAVLECAECGEDYGRCNGCNSRLRAAIDKARAT